VAFSIFGGKRAGAPKLPPKPPAAPARKETAPLQSARPQPRPAPSQSQSAADETGALDFTSLFETPAPADPAPPTPMRSPPRPGEASAEEEAAFLYSNGKVAEARERLEREVKAAPNGNERIWLMLLDLYQETGERTLFDQLALEFVVRCERSAPSWYTPSAAPVDAMLRTGGGAYVSLTGRLSADSQADIDRIRAVAEKNRLLRIDFSKLRGMDAAGCGMLHGLLQSIRRRGGDAMFSGESALLGALSKTAQPGASGVDPMLWMLRLELLQWQGRQQEFEQVALDYAVTYEISPPSFEPLVAVKSPASGVGTAAPKDVLVAPGEITGEDSVFFKELDAFAETRTLVHVDLSGLRRMDFVAAGGLLNTVIRLDEAGKQLELQRPNALVTALLDMVGVTALAKVVPRR